MIPARTERDHEEIREKCYQTEEYQYALDLGVRRFRGVQIEFPEHVLHFVSGLVVKHIGDDVSQFIRDLVGHAVDPCGIDVLFVIGIPPVIVDLQGHKL